MVYAADIGYVDITVSFTSYKPITILAGDYCSFSIYEPELFGCQFFEVADYNSNQYPSTPDATIMIDKIEVPTNLSNFTLNININFPQAYVLDGTKELKIHYVLKDNQNEIIARYSNPFVFTNYSNLP